MKQMNLLAMAKNPRGMTIDELEQLVAQCSGFVKMMAGVANNAAILIARDCYNKIADIRDRETYATRPYSPHPRYRQRVKQLFKAAIIDEYRRYRRELLHPRVDGIRFFCLSDMPASARRKYGALTDEEYFEFWEGTGVLAYQRSQPLIGSLWNKFRLSMQGYGVARPELVAWGLVGATVLELSTVVWTRAMKSVYEACEGVLTMKQVQYIYAPFSLWRLSKAWQRALMLMTPEVSEYDLNDGDERNVALGVEQLEELWVSPDLPFDATIAAVEDFSDDIFASKGHSKKAIRQLTEMRNDAVKEVEEGRGKK